jgi:putative ATP-binding cassette transporter
MRVEGWLLYAVFAYAFFVMLCIFVIGLRLELMHMASQRTEADYRAELISVRHHSEQVALANSESVHVDRIIGRFEEVRRLTWELMFLTKKVGSTNMAFSQLKEIFPFIFLGPAFLNGSITFGVLMAASRSMGLLESALLWFPGAYPGYVSWRASTDRLVRMSEACQGQQKKGLGAEVLRDQPPDELPGTASQVCIKSAKLEVWLPPRTNKDGENDEDADREAPSEDIQWLFRKLNLNMVAGQRALLVGPSGTGKSTLFRALSGAWPYATGKVMLPAGKTATMFASTEVYAPPGELRDAVSYPISSKEVEDSAIFEALALVGLSALADTPDGLGLVRCWEIALSAGQKNRLALARMALHKPKVALLDEPVAHIDPVNRAKVLKAALGALPEDATALVISHQLSDDVRSLFNMQYAVDDMGKTLTTDSVVNSQYAASDEDEAADTGMGCGMLPKC